MIDNEEKLNTLYSPFKSKVKEMIDQLALDHYQPQIIFGWRSLEKQALLVLSGHSRVKFSFHNVVDKAGIPSALAVDVVDSRYAWREPDCMPFFYRMGEIARGLGLYWGGDWKTFKDWAHVQYCDNDKLMSVKEGWMPE